MKHVTSAVLARVPGLSHGFGTIEEEVPRSLEPHWSKARPSWKQIHSTGFFEITQARQSAGEADALVTFAEGLPVAVVTADCVPVLLARKTGGAAAAIHAGWRGTLAGTVDEVIRFLQSRGERAADWVAAVGPAIGPCCYEVSEELVTEFRSKLSVPPELISPSFRKLDLPAIHEARLQQAGFAEVELIRACTQCSREGTSFRFHSFRREKNSSRQYSGLVIGPDRPPDSC